MNQTNQSAFRTDFFWLQFRTQITFFGSINTENTFWLKPTEISNKKNGLKPVSIDSLTINLYRYDLIKTYSHWALLLLPWLILLGS